MTTLSVDRDVYDQAREAAAAQGQTVDEFVREALRKAVSATRVRRTERNGLPVMVVGEGVPPIDPDEVRRCVEDEGA